MEPNHHLPTQKEELTPAVPDLGPDPSLLHVMTYAKQVVERSEALATTAEQLAGRGPLEAARGDVDVSARVAALSESARRARRAAKSVRGTMGLLALDEDAEGALITLELIRSAEGQVWEATVDALEHLEGIRGALRAEKAADEVLANHRIQARTQAEEAIAVASEAYKLTGTIESNLANKTWSAPGTEEALEIAIRAAEETHSAAQEASSACDAVEEASSLASATLPAGEARTALDAAKGGLERVQRAIQNATNIEQRACEQAITHTRSIAQRTDVAAAACERAMSRGVEAVGAPTDATMTAQLTEAKAHTQSARASATRARQALDALEGQTRWADVQETRAQVEACAAETETARQTVTRCVDELLRRSGEAQAKHARLSGAHDGVREIQALLKTQLARVQGKADEVAVLCRQVHDADALELGEQVREDGQSLLGDLGLIDATCEAMLSSTDPVEIEQRTGSLREQLIKTEVPCGNFERLASEALTLGRQALAVIQQQRDDDAQLITVKQQAQAYAMECQTLLDGAKARWKDLTPLVQSTHLPILNDLRHKAHEIIDVAQFQCGEAVSSGEYAQTQSDLREASDHMTTARGFATRIREDLPDAHRYLDRVETLAREEQSRIEETRAAIGSAIQEIGDDQDAMEGFLTVAADKSGLLRQDDRVTIVLERIHDACATDKALLQACDDLLQRVDDCRTSEALDRLVPESSALRNRSMAQRTKAKSILDQLFQRIDEVESERNAVTAARHAVDSALTKALTMLERFEAARTQFSQAVSRHQPDTATMDPFNTKLDQLGVQLHEQRQAIEGLQQTVHARQDTSETAASAERVREHLQQLEQLLEQAESTAEMGTSAAEQDAKDRAHKAEHDLLEARTDVHQTTERIRAMTDRLAGELAQANPQLAGEDAPEILNHHAKAREALRSVEELATKAAAVAARADTQELAMVGSSQTQVHQIHAWTQDQTAVALEHLQHALDIARSSAQEQEALGHVRAEVDGILAKARSTRQDLAAFADGLREIASRDTESQALLRDLLEAMSQQEKLADASVRKAEAAQPMAQQAEVLAVAQRVLETSRRAASRVEEATHVAQRHVNDARSRVRAADEAAQRHLDQTRNSAQFPATEAATLAEQAVRWLHDAQTASEGLDDHGVAQTLAGLTTAVEAMVASSADATQAAEQSKAAEKLEQAASHAEQALLAAQRTQDLAREARGARTLHEEALQALAESIARRDAFQLQTAQSATQAQEVASQCRLNADRLASAIAELGVTPSDVLTEALELIVDATGEAESAASRAMEQAQVAVSSPKEEDAANAAAKANSECTKALHCLEMLVAGEEAARLEMARVQQEHEASLREAEEAQRAEAERARRAKEAAEQAARDAEQAARRDELEARRARFSNRSAATTGTPAASVGGGDKARDALRARLQSSRPDAPAPRSDSPKRSRIDERLGRRPGGTSDDSADGAKRGHTETFTPGRGRTVGGRSIQRRRRPTADAPSGRPEGPSTVTDED